ncbi:hypothetical protein Agub_g12209 [Astrephomene gubernaculifera]|uniref:Thioredoxin domain-containing protein n=1 Tax=Astrephomene gubernaculifera TaxID=47775 RepID=A0AAD3E069_9CHLO|nr:hypothetical protein Agub_g12209 [Astrephomene gubernaculifera]
MSDKPDDVICEGGVCRRLTPEEVAASKAAASADNGSAENLPAVFQHLGSALLGQDGKNVPVSSIIGPNKVIALYFSAHWCPPCRGFTPVLAETYRSFKAKHARAADWEVVFVSSDRDEASFKEYFGEMPWLALPFERRDAKAELSRLFKVRGIPTLVLLDAASGELITANGRDAVGDDPECENFPWKPRTFEQIMEGAMLVDPPSSEAGAPAPTPTPALDRLRGKYTLLYFSASWCPPCRRFTPMLVEALKALREGLAAGKLEGAAGAAGVEAVFVSGDRKEEDMCGYHSHMTWPALPFEDRKRAAELNMLFEVEGIPTLVVLDPDFKVTTMEGTGAVSTDPAGRRFPWRPQPLEQLTPSTASRINDGPLMLLLVGEELKEQAEAEAFAEATLKSVAVATKAAPGGDAWSFLWAQKKDDLALRVLMFAGMVEEPAEEEGEVKLPEGHLAVLLDVPGAQSTWDLGAKGVEISAAGLGAVVEDYKAGRLGPGRKLGGDDDDSDEE